MKCAEKVQLFIGKNCKLVNIRLIAEELNLNMETVKKITTEDMQMNKISAKTVSKIMSDS